MFGGRAFDKNTRHRSDPRTSVHHLGQRANRPLALCYLFNNYSMSRKDMANTSQPSAHPFHSRIENQYNSENARVHNGPYIYIYIYIYQSSTNPTQERITILNWSSPLRPVETHNDFRKQVPIQSNNTLSLSGDWTGKWLLESDDSTDWTTRKISHLWYHGMREL